MANISLKQTFVEFSKKILNWVKSNCVNNCVSTSTNLPLAAAQGKALQDQITTLNSNLGGYKVVHYNEHTTCDCNNMIRGIYMYKGAKNAPNLGYGVLFSTVFDDNSQFIVQIAFVLGVNSVYIRQSNAGTFSNWRIFNPTS